jgi:carbon starvation protein CstA
MFGWLPALIWILVGSIFIGGVHDFTALVASIRHKARSIAEVVRDHMSQRSYILFLTFVWLALVYIIVAFTDVTADSFIGSMSLEDGTVVTGGGIATSSLLYLAIPIVMGLMLRYTKLSLGLATVIFLPLVGVAIWIGQSIPFDVEAMVLKRDALFTSYYKGEPPSLSPQERDFFAKATPQELRKLSELSPAEFQQLQTLSVDESVALTGLSAAEVRHLLTLQADQAERLTSMSAEETEHISAAVKSARNRAHKIWDVVLLAYCCIASVVPLWLLLQPRGHLGGYFLYAALGGGALGLVLGGRPIQYPSFIGWTSANGETLVPILFITIACGACSGFHSIIASGTTSKQLRRETDARLIGYGAMLLEAMVAVVSLCCVMMLATDAKELTSAGGQPSPNLIYARGIGNFLEAMHVPPALGISFALMAFTTFVYDTLDVCTRLGRYIVQELTGWRGAKGKWLGTILTAGVPAFFVTQTMLDPIKKTPIPVWKTFWALFGASNQLLAALTLLGVTVWLWRTRRARWVWFVTGIPMVWMYVMSSWALIRFVVQPLKPWIEGTSGLGELFQNGAFANPVPWVAAVLVGLALLMLIEAIRVIAGSSGGRVPPEQAVPVAA